MKTPFHVSNQFGSFLQLNVDDATIWVSLESTDSRTKYRFYSLFQNDRFYQTSWAPGTVIVLPPIWRKYNRQMRYLYGHAEKISKRCRLAALQKLTEESQKLGLYE